MSTLTLRLRRAVAMAIRFWSILSATICILWIPACVVFSEPVSDPGWSAPQTSCYLEEGFGGATTVKCRGDSTRDKLTKILHNTPRALVYVPLFMGLDLLESPHNPAALWLAARAYGLTLLLWSPLVGALYFVVSAIQRSKSIR
jgi:hypothetical protein